MQVRGAPAIAIVGALSVAVELRRFPPTSTPLQVFEFVRDKFSYLKTARPTAVNMSETAEKFTKRASELYTEGADVNTMITTLIEELSQVLADDVKINKAIGHKGAEHILSLCAVSQKVTVLTHCNTGSLATGGYGTALGVMRRLFELGRLDCAYCTETRPYNQGSRLTAYELVHDKIPCTLICDSMAAFLMKERVIHAVIVGADRVVANGDTANKIGTYQLAVAAKYHNVPFYVAAPMTSIDFSLRSGTEVVIEERSETEMTSLMGVKIAPSHVRCWNPAFDITPFELITGGIITEHGVYAATQLSLLQS